MRGAASVSWLSVSWPRLDGRSMLARHWPKLRRMPIGRRSPTSRWPRWRGSCAGRAAQKVAQPRPVLAARLHHRIVARDAGIEYLLGGLTPPVIGENLDFRRPGVARRLDPAADFLQLDDAITHHAAIVEEIAGRQQPVTDVVGQQPLAARPRDLALELGIPPGVIDVDRDADGTGAVGVERIADIERLFDGIDAGAIGRLHGMQRF